MTYIPSFCSRDDEQDEPSNGGRLNQILLRLRVQLLAGGEGLTVVKYVTAALELIYNGLGIQETPSFRLTASSMTVGLRIVSKN